jgi:Arc/MetJ-type ribon-helix-helix transcriptional regulator
VCAVVSKNKDEWINVRVEPDVKTRIQGIVDESNGRYDRPSDWVREAISDKLDDRKRIDRAKRDLIEVLKDPRARRELGLPENKLVFQD